MIKISWDTNAYHDLTLYNVYVCQNITIAHTYIEFLHANLNIKLKMKVVLYIWGEDGMLGTSCREFGLDFPESFMKDLVSTWGPLNFSLVRKDPQTTTKSISAFVFLCLILFWAQFVALSGHKLETLLLLLPPKFWYCVHEPPCPAPVLLRCQIYSMFRKLQEASNMEIHVSKLVLILKSWEQACT